MDSKQVKVRTEQLMKQGGKIIQKIDQDGKHIEQSDPTGLTRGFARTVARNQIRKFEGYAHGQLGSSKVAGLDSRRDRRKAARENGVEFEPQFNGTEPQTHEEMFGVGNERFNNKFVTIK